VDTDSKHLLSIINMEFLVWLSNHKFIKRGKIRNILFQSSLGI